jgi:hypothetical protein
MASKGKKATPQDAQLLLQLYDLRRETVMRKARNFIIGEFWPATYDEFKAVASAFGSEHNAYFRQVLTYWDMACAMVVQGAIDEDLFFKTNGEPYFIYAKYKQFIAQTRKDFGNPEFLFHIEQLATKPQAKDRIKRIEAMIQARGDQLRAAAKAAK